MDSISDDPNRNGACNAHGALPHGALPHGALPDLEGVWRVERAGGLLPPMAGVRKRIEGARRDPPRPPGRLALRNRAAPGGFRLVYRPPFSAFVDEVQPGPDGSWAGSSTVGGYEFGRFSMRRVGEVSLRSKGERMADREGLRRVGRVPMSRVRSSRKPRSIPSRPTASSFGCVSRPPIRGRAWLHSAAASASGWSTCARCRAARTWSGWRAG